MKWIWLLMLLASVPLMAQGEGAPTDAPAPDTAEETEDQKNTREISMLDLQEADARLNSEREAVTKRERRLAILMESMNNQNDAITAKESSVQKMLRDFKDDQGDVSIPQIQVDHWESRVASVAAQDFALLYENEPAVAVGLIKRMKKKKSARLIDAVAKLENKNGVKIAAELHEAIGTGVIKEKK